MTVRTIVEMFEKMACSMDTDEPAHTPESLGRGNVHGLVSYYDALGVVEEVPIIVPTKTVRIVHGQLTVGGSEVQDKGVQQQREQEQVEQEQIEKVEVMRGDDEVQEEEKKESIHQPSNQDISDLPTAPVSSPPRLTQDYSLPISKIPPPKSREYHLAASSVRKPSSDNVPPVQMFSTISTDRIQPHFVPPPTPISTRIRGPRTSYAAFATKIENSTSRLLDFEKDERWLGQVEAMKCRVEMLKRRNQLALAREVASSPRKNRSMSECSGVSTASTASMSSMDLPELSCQ